MERINCSWCSRLMIYKIHRKYIPVRLYIFDLCCRKCYHNNNMFNKLYNKYKLDQRCNKYKESDMKYILYAYIEDGYSEKIIDERFYN